MGKLGQRCLFCGRIFENEAPDETVSILPGLTPKAKSICPICEARIKKEAEDAWKDPKPM